MSALLESLLTPEQHAAAVAADEKQAAAAPLRLDGTDPCESMALMEALCDPDEIGDFIAHHCFQATPNPDLALRILRLPHRLESADVAALMSAAMSSAYRGDVMAAGDCLHELARRYVAERSSWIVTRAGELRASVDPEADAADRRRDERKHGEVQQ